MKAIRLRTEYLKNPIGIDIVQPRFFWVCENGKFQTAYRIVAKAENNQIVWDSGKVVSKKMRALYGGKALESRDIISWQVCLWDENDVLGELSETAFFEIGLISRTEWKAKWINPELETDSKKRCPASLLRHEFSIPASIKKARLYITSCGIYEAYINGKKVGNQLFTPGTTSYKKRIQYQTYDVTTLLTTGKNAVGAHIGDGWFRGSNGMRSICNIFGDNIALLCQLEIITENDTITICSDTDWKATQNGAVRQNDLKHGEVYDAGMKLDGWAETGFDDTSWHGVLPFDWSYDALIGSNSVPISEMETFTPTIITTPKGETVLDFGQNICGYVEFSVKGKKGDTVGLIHGEALDGNGNFTMAHLESTRKGDTPIGQKITYTLRGGSVEKYKPQFSVFGFRFVKLENWCGEVKPESFTAIAVYSEIEQTGWFSCSEPLVNRLVKNTLWSQKGNFLDIPTDCPQRERAGYTGDAQVFVETGSFLMDTPAFYRKWLLELGANQAENGMISNINPVQDPDYTFFDGSAGWGDAAVIVPYKLYRKYGDIEFLKENYETMKKWVEYEAACARKSRFINKFSRNPYKNYFWDINFHWGEWLEPNQSVMVMVKNTLFGVPEVATAFLSYSSRLLSESAGILGFEDDAKKYKELSENARKAYIYKYTKNGRIKSKR